MVRISNAEIPENKNVLVSLTYIYGIGRSQSQRIIDSVKVKAQKKVRELTEQEIKLISEEIKQFPVEGQLREKIKKDISRQVRIGTYRGIRLSREPCPLPVNGQKTRHNGRTARLNGRKRQTVANKKKAPSAK